MSYYQRSRRPARSWHSSGSSRPNRRKNTKENIHPSRFIKAATSTQTAAYEAKHAFADFNLNPLIAGNIRAKGIETPTPIQDQAIPIGLNGRDVIGIANTGTGKTIAFAVPMLQKLIAERSSKALIMAPTRELASQIEEECRSIAKGSGITGALLIGGTSMGAQLRDLRNRPSIVIGTPGRIKDHLERRSLDLSGFNIVVLDEVDRMLDMGFVNDMRLILKQIGEPRQSFFFSATVDFKVDRLIQEFSKDPVSISVKVGDTTDTVEQNVVAYSGHSEKLNKLHDLLIKDSPKALVFDDTQRSVERLSKELRARGFAADAIHGGKTQGQRQRALKRFKTNEINVLVATDVAARGLDVTDITHVINYSTPGTYDDYIHRVGRAGRAGQTGYALTFIES